MFMLADFKSSVSNRNIHVPLPVPFRARSWFGLVMQVLHEITGHSINREKMVSILLLAYRVSE